MFTQLVGVSSAGNRRRFGRGKGLLVAVGLLLLQRYRGLADLDQLRTTGPNSTGHNRSEATQPRQPKRRRGLVFVVSSRPRWLL